MYAFYTPVCVGFSPFMRRTAGKIKICGIGKIFRAEKCVFEGRCKALSLYEPRRTWYNKVFPKKGDEKNGQNRRNRSARHPRADHTRRRRPRRHRCRQPACGGGSGGLFAARPRRFRDHGSRRRARAGQLRDNGADRGGHPPEIRRQRDDRRAVSDPVAQPLRRRAAGHRHGREPRDSAALLSVG